MASWTQAERWSRVDRIESEQVAVWGKWLGANCDEWVRWLTFRL